MFDSVQGPAKFPEIDAKIRDFWRENNIQSLSFDKSGGRGEYVFYEGPPTANGKPGIHHVLTRVFKDLIPRFKTMQGYRVRRRGGWDTHGLPVEIEIEKQIGSTGKRDIERFGIAEFNAMCRSSVFRHIQEWNDLTERAGFWLNLDDAYITYKNTYIETCWWILKNLWDRGLLYEAYKTTMHCPRCNSTLADHEVSQGTKEDVDDPSVWPMFPADTESLRERNIVPDASPVFFLAWTTTPWTLGANVALAVKADALYALVRSQGKRYIVALELARATFGEENYDVENEFPGSQLVGAKYSPIMKGRVPASSDMTHAYRVITDPSVTIEDGTGIVHIAPAYGDLEIGKKNDLPTAFSVDLEGRMFDEVGLVDGPAGEYTGLFFKDADNKIIRDLTAAGRMYRFGRIKHSYPFCWRDDSPLLFYAKNSWYIRTSEVKEQMLRNNQQVNWIPENIKNGRFGNWLENNVDWAISRERYWGATLPVWVSEDGEERVCVGSVAELEALAGRSLGDLDLHRPVVDEVTFERAGKRFRRVPYTIDVWFESGAMPYAQWHYPFENQSDFNISFPADFVCEAMDQTRGWFYSLHAIASLLTMPDGPLAADFPPSSAFKNCMVLGFVNDAKGQKMSKSRGNTIDPWSVLDQYGADPVRWYLYTCTAPELNKSFDPEQLSQVARGFFQTLWNSYSFFVMYANLDKPDLTDLPPVKSRALVDRWILAKASQVVRDVTQRLNDFDIQPAARAISEFIVNDVSNWYIRLNRRRYWKSDDDQDKQAAYATLYEVLVTVVKLCAPFAPFISEEIYQNLVRKVSPTAPASVHLDTWPADIPEWRDDALIEDMEVAARIVELGRAARSKATLKIRQPLEHIAVYSPAKASGASFEELIKEELNIKAIRPAAQISELMDLRAALDLAKTGAVFGPRLPAIRKAFLAASQADILRDAGSGRPYPLAVDGQTAQIEPEMVVISKTPNANYAVAEGDGFVVGLYTVLNDELIKEGLARDIVRFIQDARKKAGLEISERIHLGFITSNDLRAVIEQYEHYIAGEVLAQSVTFAPQPESLFRSDVTVGKSNLSILLDRIQPDHRLPAGVLLPDNVAI